MQVVWIVEDEEVASQSLSGWGGVFNVVAPRELGLVINSRNPFQGGVGFSTAMGLKWLREHKLQSQSLSGWGGVFNLPGVGLDSSAHTACRNPFQGGMGFSTE